MGAGRAVTTIKNPPHFDRHLLTRKGFLPATGIMTAVSFKKKRYGRSSGCNSVADENVVATCKLLQIHTLIQMGIFVGERLDPCHCLRYKVASSEVFVGENQLSDH